MTDPIHQSERLKPPMLITVRNRGKLLVSTNYWETEQAESGLIYLSTNAGCLRLLVPRALLGQTVETFLADATKGVIEVILTRGVFQGRPNFVEIMFEDNSPSPFMLHIDPKQLDRQWRPSDEGKPGGRFDIYTQTDGKVAEFPCFLRSSPRLPHARPYTGRRS